jgi:predicted Ser/Thr protein kinase
MTNLTEKELSGLKSDKNIDFITSFNELTNKLKNREYDFQEFEETLRVIFEADLQISEKCRRSSLIVKKSLPLLNKEKFVQIISNLPPEIKSGITQVIPKEYLPFVFESKNRKEDIRTTKNLPPLKNEVTDQPSSVIESRDSAIILLSTIENQNPNISLLTNEGFSASRITSEEDLDTQLSSSDICGFVIDGSFWIGKSSDQQDEILRKVSRYSTIACLFVDTTNFHSPTELFKKVEESYPRTPESNRFQLRNNSSLQAADLPLFEASAGLLSKITSTQFLLYDLSEVETTALIASATAFYRKECNNQTKVLDLLRIKTVTGGRSCEKIVAIYFDGGAMPCIAKIGIQKSIMNEYDRFREFINIDDNQLKPYVHFHSGVGIIIWGSICDPATPLELAPTLEGQISKACGEEVWGKDCNSLDKKCENLKTVLNRATEKLFTLNSKAYNGYNAFVSLTSLRGSSLRDLENKGINFNLPIASGKDEITSYIEKARKILEPNNKRAIIHGDINLRNILVRDNTDACIIDYDSTGLGHPAYDLVRLECSIVLQFLRALGTEDDFVELQKSISVDFENIEILEQKHPVWFSSSVNKVLLEAVVNCRNKCLELLQIFGLGKEDYIATKFIMCCYSIALPQLQMGFVRGSIRALAANFD